MLIKVLFTFNHKIERGRKKKSKEEKDKKKNR